MTRILTCGYETGDVAEAGATTTGGASPGTISVVSTVPTPRAGAYCLKAAYNGTTGSAGAQAYKGYNFGAAKTDVWARFAFLIHGYQSTTETMIGQVLDSAAGVQTTLTYLGSDGLLRIRLGPNITGTVLGTATTALSADTWHVIEWRTQILTTTTGTTEVWLDGNRVINFSGDNSNTSNVNTQSLLLGQVNSLGSNATINGQYIGIDDIAINDTNGTVNNGRPGDGRVILLIPNGAGSSTQWTRGGTDTGANYSQVNELPPSLLQYNASSTVGNRDLYALSDIPVVVQSINVAEVILLAQNSDAGGGSIGPTLKSGAITNEATAVSLTATPVYVTARYETDPNTSAAWTAAAVNALEVGATVR